MTLNEWRLEHHLHWHDIARKLTDQGQCQVLEGRLNRLRRGKAPMPPEYASLLLMTDGDVESFRDEL